MIPILIFLAKTVENSLSTLRIIIINNDMKTYGSLLNGLIALIWIITTGLVVTKYNDFYRVIAFITGSILGSYLGSIIEEKLALGSSIIIAINDKSKSKNIVKSLKNYGFKSTLVESKIKDLIIIITPKKRVNKISKIINKIDLNSIIITEAIYPLNKKSLN